MIISRDTRYATGGLALIVLIYVTIAIQYAALTPAWQVPDEPAHYNYVRRVVEKGALPVLDFGDYDQQYNERFTDPTNTPNLSIDPLRYEYHQPPLYYLLAAPVYALTGGSLFALRLTSVAFGAALIVVACCAVREVKPDRPGLALGAAAFVAFVPQHVAMMSGVNNDSLAELLLALVLLQTFRVIPQRETEEPKKLIVLGVLLGLGLITKTTAYLAVPIVITGLLLKRPRHTSLVTRHLLLVFAPALLIGSLWWLRNLSVYGGFDILGLARHNTVVAGQPLTADWIARLGFGPFLLSALTTTFHSFWGQFGWMGVPMPDWVYLGLGVLTIAAAAGWLSTLRLHQPTNKLINPPANPHSTLLFLLIVLTLAAYVWYNLTFVQHQGRYLFPALIPIGLAFAIGIDRWARLLPRPIGVPVFTAVFVGLAVLDVYALYRFVIPSLAR